MTLFVRPKDPSKELWEGARTGEEGAVRWFGADEAYDIGQLAGKLRSLLTQTTDIPVYLDLPTDTEPLLTRSRKTPSSLLEIFSPSSSQNADLLSVLSSPFRSSSRNVSDLDACLSVLATALVGQTRSRTRKSSKYRPIKSLQQVLDPIKMIKSSAEIKLLRKAADISAHGHKAAMRLANRNLRSRLENSHASQELGENATIDFNFWIGEDRSARQIWRLRRYADRAETISRYRQSDVRGSRS